MIPLLLSDYYQNHRKGHTLTIMIHTIVVKIIHLGWLALPMPLYALYNRHYLDQKQAQLLLAQTILLIGLMLPGWINYVIKLVVEGFFVLIVLDLCIAEYEEFLSRYEIGDKGKRRSKKFRTLKGKQLFMVNYYKTLKKFKFQETFILPPIIFLWILIKIHFTKAHEYGEGQPLPDGTLFSSFLTTLDGWNCNYSEHTAITLLWLLVLLFCWWFISGVLECAKRDDLMTEQYYNDINGYKIYLLAYLIRPALLVSGVDFGYNAVAHLMSEGMLDCYDYFKYGIGVVWIGLWGVPLCIGLFFYKKVGRFSLQSEHENTHSQISHDEGNNQRENLLQQLSN